MTDMVCPNCHSVTAPLQHCLVCNAFLGNLLEDVFENAPSRIAKPPSGYLAKAWWSLTNLLALAWSALRCFLTSSKSGRPMSVPMDAYLRRDCWRMQKLGIHKLATSSAKEGEIAVIAKVRDRDLDGFEKQVKKQDGRVTTKVEGNADDPTTIVTARIRGDQTQLERLRQLEGVESLKAARRMRPFLERTRQEVFSCDDSLAAFPEAKDAERVIIGIVDFGLDFVHRNFRHADGSTRILALWDQKVLSDRQHTPAASGYPFDYGRLFEKDEIDKVLDHGHQAAAPDKAYTALGYEVPKDSLFDTGAHGTYVTDVAAGNGLGSSCPGIAPRANIVFVDVSTAGTPMQGPQSVGSTFGDSVQLLEAIQFIFDYAKNRPCVVNISLGTNGGPHDGTTLLEQAMDRLVKQKPNRAIVIAAGNSFGKKLHATGRVPEGGWVDLKWHISRFDATSNELEIWYAGEDKFTLDLLDPRGKLAARVRPGEQWETPRGCQGQMIVVNRLNDPNNRDNTINVFFERGVHAGDWTLRLHGDTVYDGHFHAWIERDEQGQSRFAQTLDKSYEISDECTLSSIACGRETIVVSSYNAYEPDLPLSDSSSSGPTRDQDQREPQQQQPTVSAPGEHVLAALSGTLVLRHRQSGTSMAAPVVAGTIVLMLAKAQAQQMTLTTDQIRKILIRTAHRHPPSGNGWDPGFGFGRVCTKAAVADVGSDIDDSLDQHRQRAQKEASPQELAYYF
ncbi:MAG: S8 family serine peptidase [Blastocatellia bacterium]